MIGRLVVLLLAANLAWWAWTQGWLRDLGLGPAVQTEPERVQRQIRPEALRVEPIQAGDRAERSASAPAVAEAASAPADTDSVPAAAQTPAAPVPAADTPVAQASAPTGDAPAGLCLQAGVFDERQANALRGALAAWPSGSWRLDEVQLPGRWMVYVGKLADAAAVSAKRAELRAKGIDTDRPGSALEPGLSLGRFGSEEAAERALSDLARKGVRTARVVQERRDTPGYRLRLTGTDEGLTQRARGLRSALAGRELRPCD